MYDSTVIQAHTQAYPTSIPVLYLTIYLTLCTLLLISTLISPLKRQHPNNLGCLDKLFLFRNANPYHTGNRIFLYRVILDFYI